MSKTTRIGIDIGGTFTDFVLHDETRGITKTGKRLTTHDNPGRAMIEGISRLLSETNTKIENVQSIIHGTTLITNTVLERTGAKVGLLTTGGFRDSLEMGREIRYDVDNLHQKPAPVIVPRNLRRDVFERLLACGEIHTPLDKKMVEQEVTDLVENENIEALAISFLHAYRNPIHEQQALKIIQQKFPNLYVTLSSEIAPEIREYERTNTACTNAYVQPRVHGYLARLKDDLSQLGFGGDLSIMLSSGGLTSIEDAMKFPVRLIESGPAAGAMAAAFIARQIEEDQVISFDMGGTTAKMCLIENAEPKVKYEFEAGRLERFKAGSGLPLKITVIDMIEISGGGGSLAKINSNGLMNVGPRSAGSMPGPIAYGQGGTVPTVTDADLVLGYLDPEYFLGGEMELGLSAVRDGIDNTLAKPLNINIEKAASGILDIVSEDMAAATRMYLAEKGKDPRAHTMVAFGGAGPVHAYGLAKALKINRIIVPMGAGVISAFGFLVAAPTTNLVRGYFSKLDTVDWRKLLKICEEMQRQARQNLMDAGANIDDIEFSWSADMRYHGQGFEISVPLAFELLAEQNTDMIITQFNAEYKSLFGRIVDNARIEVVNWRLSASVPAQHISLAHTANATPRIKENRDVYFSGFGKVKTQIYDRYGLLPGTKISGPAVFEERESSFNIGPDADALIDEHYNIIVEIH